MARFHLMDTDDGLALQDRFRDQPPLLIDFANARLSHRRLQGGKKELLLRAVGAKPGLRVEDWTAGLGTDSFLLASGGCSVKMYERSTVVFLLLRDALKRGAMTPSVAEIVSRMELEQGSGNGSNPVDVIYLDPMFPQRKKTALVNGSMQYLQQFLGADEDADQLVERALATNAKRIVVKRPAKALKSSATFSLSATANRFDVYERIAQ